MSEHCQKYRSITHVKNFMPWCPSNPLYEQHKGLIYKNWPTALNPMITTSRIEQYLFKSGLVVANVERTKIPKCDLTQGKHIGKVHTSESKDCRRVGSRKSRLRNLWPINK